MFHTSLVPAGLALAVVVALASAHAQDAPTPAADATHVVRIERRALDAGTAKSLDAACNEAGGRCEVIRKRIEGRPMLGVILQPDAASGVRIAGVTPRSPAADAGLRTGDRLVTIDGRTLDAADADARLTQAREALRTAKTGTPVALRFARDGRTSDIRVTPRADVQALSWSDDAAMPAGMRTIVMRRKDGSTQLLDGAELDGVVPPEAMRVIRQELHRVGPDCNGPSCKAPMLLEAFRWNGLNLASVDAKLGRYFGAQRGVLVLSPGEVLDGLEAGDVIQRIDAREVDTPRAAMDALRAKPADAPVAVTYLRDRASRTTQVTVPRAPDLAMLAPPPPPPAPPAPPAPPSQRAMPAPLAPPSPPAPPSGESAPTPPPPPPPPPVPPARRDVPTAPAFAIARRTQANALRRELRHMVLVDHAGVRREWRVDDAPAGHAPRVD